MRLLWVTANFRPEIGGMQTYTEQLVEFLSRDHEVGLVTAWGQSLPPASRAEHWICPGLGSSRFRFQWIAARNRLRRIALQFQPDLIHLANAGMTVYADLLADTGPLVASVHGNDFRSPWQLTPGHDPTTLILAGLRRCRKLIAVSHYVADQLSVCGIETPCDVIHNSCDLDLFYPRNVDREAILKHWRIPPQREIILTVSRLDRRKGHLVILEALRRLNRPWHWIVTGEGRMHSELVALIRRYDLTGRVTLTGNLVGENLANLYCAADLFVLVPLVLERAGRLDAEGFGIVFQEANACGIPVIASNTAGCGEAVVPGRTARVVPPGDPEALSNAIYLLLSDRAGATTLGRNGLDCVRSQGGWGAVGERVARFYREVVAPAARLSQV